MARQTTGPSVGHGGLGHGDAGHGGTGHNEKLIDMANQIADFFRPYPPDQAAVGIHDHIAAYWTPGMRADILAQAGQAGDRFDPLVLQAIRSFPTGDSPIRKETAGPDEVGQLGSDAG